MVKGFIVYRIYYGDKIVYIGRTKQPLQNRIRGHLFSKPMHRTVAIEQVTKIEYAEFQTEADMNLYEIYFILKWHPPLNVDDKTRDYPTVDLPPVEWKGFRTHLWDKWTKEIHERTAASGKLMDRYHRIPEEIRVLRSAMRVGTITDDEYCVKKQALCEEMERIKKALWG